MKITVLPKKEEVREPVKWDELETGMVIKSSVGYTAVVFYDPKAGIGGGRRLLLLDAKGCELNVAVGIVHNFDKYEIVGQLSEVVVTP